MAIWKHSIAETQMSGPSLAASKPRRQDARRRGKILARTARARWPGQAGERDLVERQQRVVIRVGRQNLAPDSAQVAPFAFEPFRRLESPAHRGLEKPCVRRLHDPQTARPQPQTIIDVMISDRKMLTVESADFKKQAAAS